MGPVKTALVRHLALLISRPSLDCSERFSRVLPLIPPVVEVLDAAESLIPRIFAAFLLFGRRRCISAPRSCYCPVHRRLKLRKVRAVAAPAMYQTTASRLGALAKILYLAAPFTLSHSGRLFTMIEEFNKGIT